MNPIFFFFFFSSRRRHTRCALVTGVQTCALPICGENEGVHIWFRDRHYGLLAIRPGETLRSAAGCACGGPACDGYFRPAAGPTGEPIAMVRGPVTRHRVLERSSAIQSAPRAARSEEHTSELQSLMRISYAVFCLKKKNNKKT